MNKNSDLTKKTCTPCHLIQEPLGPEKAALLLEELGNCWKIVDNHHLERTFEFKDFKDALIFTNYLGEIAEQEGHHPDIYLSYAKVTVTIWTHKIKGLSEEDFILAEKYNHYSHHSNG